MKPYYCYNRSTEAAFIEQVRQMREAQIAYFTERTSRLKIAREWEAKVDKQTCHDIDGLATSFDQFRELVKDMRKAQCQYFLASAAGLVWHHIKDIICPNEEEQKILQTFFDGIDMEDTNRGDIHQVWYETMPLGMRHTSHLIAGFNRGTEAPLSDKAFAKAVKFARKILENEIYAAEKWVQAIAIYEQRITLPNGVAVFSEYNTVWRYYALHLVALMPNKDGWQILSRDTNKFVIPESATDADGCVFRHANGFMAIFEKREQAIEFAQNLQLP